MSAPVDVLAVLNRAAAREVLEMRAPLAEARAAVAELIREADLIAAALDADSRTADGMTKAVAVKRLRAALARVGGAK